MEEITLESLAKRVAALEQMLKQNPPRVKDILSVAGMFRGSDVMRQIAEEGRKIREAEREAARNEP